MIVKLIKQSFVLPKNATFQPNTAAKAIEHESTLTRVQSYESCHAQCDYRQKQKIPQDSCAIDTIPTYDLA